MTDAHSHKKTGLILSGGGARAAYQIGVLTAIAEILPPGCKNPFDIICGTSAGAFNACALATRAKEFHVGVERLSRIWSNFSCDQVYRTDFVSISQRAWRVLWTIIAGKKKNHSLSLLDNAPLRQLVIQILKLHRIQEAIDSGDLHALAISTSGYSSGESVTFFQGATEAQPWNRVHRIGVATQITYEHLLASSAIPLLFAPVKINREYFGDGAVRQKSPLSPALHLGADKILVVGVSANQTQIAQRLPKPSFGAPPSIAQMIGHVMNSAFVDAFEGDIEMLLRINQTVAQIPEHLRTQHTMRPVDLLVIAPSQPVDEIAAKHVKSLPRTLRLFLRGTGATDASGASALSYLLFESSFCRELIALGYHDTIIQEQAVRAFFAR